MTTARFIVGDSLTVLRSLPDASVDLVVTSPPFLALRSYLPADHPDKALEMGSEATPGEFLDALLDVIVECRRVLAPHGSLCVELGDTYSGSGGAGGDYAAEGLRDGQPAFTGSAARSRSGWHRDGNAEGERSGQRFRQEVYEADSRSPKGGDGWPEAKSLVLIPESFRFALVYGRNPFTGRELEPWRVRNVVRWCRPNPPVGALGDKFRPATSDIAIACTSRTRYFDLDAVRYQAQGQARVNGNGPKALRWVEEGVDGLGRYANRIDSNPGGAPPLDWWEVVTEGYPGSHYATFPSKLIDRLIQSMCPARVCTTCGEPSRRITETTNAVGVGFSRNGNHGLAEPGAARAGDKNRDQPDVAGRVTLGWTDCGHNSWRKGVVLDPFAGSGTTLAVATGHGHDAIGIDLDERNADLAAERVGFFLTVERPSVVDATNPMKVQ